MVYLEAQWLPFWNWMLFWPVQRHQKYCKNTKPKIFYYKLRSILSQIFQDEFLNLISLSLEGIQKFISRYKILWLLDHFANPWIGQKYFFRPHEYLSLRQGCSKMQTRHNNKPDISTNPSPRQNSSAFETKLNLSYFYVQNYRY